MTSIHTLALVTSSWAVLMALSPILQIRAIVHTRSAESVSVGYFLVLTVGFVLWTVLGLARNDMILVVPNVVAAVLGVTTIVVALRFGADA